ncbi:DUF3494 domain-containing protein [Candidatus Nomurabacteria bacterium]|nr:DUF3494 domain-containing protein [Candidatus Nomurabacteria bacterium]
MKKFIKVLVLVFVLSFLGTGTLFAAGPATVNLGAAASFRVLSKTAISTTGTTAITGDIGISPAAATFMTGFSPTMDVSNTYSTSSYVVGKLYASDYAVPTPANMSTAISNMEAAYTDAAGRSADVTELGAGNIGGMTLVPGVYKWSTGLTIPTNVTLSGTASDTWIFQIAGNLDIASAKSVVLSGGALPSNIFWAVAGTTTLNTTSNFSGTILAGPVTSTIAMKNGAVLNGRALGQKDVTLIGNTIVSSGGSVPQLTVTKVVINDDGGSKVVSDFPLFVSGTPVISGHTNNFLAGTYAITETTNTGYTQTFSGDCNSSGSITLVSGSNLTCTITNNDIHQSSGGSGGGTVYGCKDPTATNYNYFVASNPALCVYGNSTSAITTTPAVTTVTTTSVTIPKLPKTGFPPETWYEFMLNSFLNLFK